MSKDEHVLVKERAQVTKTPDNRAERLAHDPAVPVAVGRDERRVLVAGQVKLSESGEVVGLRHDRVSDVKMWRGRRDHLADALVCGERLARHEARFRVGPQEIGHVAATGRRAPRPDNDGAGRRRFDVRRRHFDDFEGLRRDEFGGEHRWFRPAGISGG